MQGVGEKRRIVHDELPRGCDIACRDVASPQLPDVSMEPYFPHKAEADQAGGGISMYTVAIVEDDAAHAAELARMIEASPVAECLELAMAWRAADNVRRRPSGDASRHPLDNGSHHPLSAAELPDILFVDVRLADGVNGIDLVRRLIPSAAPVQIIYVSAYLEYAPAAYHTRHTWFLSKPVVQDELDAALARAVEALDTERAEPLLVHQGSSLIRIAPHEVRYIESDRRKVRIHEHARTVEAYARISELETQLPEQFVRCHKSFLVNLAYVMEFTGRELVLADGTHLPVSQRCRKTFAERLMAFVRRTL